MLQQLNASVGATCQGITLSLVDIHHPAPAPAPILRNFSIPHHSITHTSHPQCTRITCNLQYHHPHLRHNPCWTTWLALLHTNSRIHLKCRNPFTRSTHWTNIDMIEIYSGYTFNQFDAFIKYRQFRDNGLNRLFSTNLGSGSCQCWERAAAMVWF